MRENERREPGEEPCYVISVAARLVEINIHTLRYYERMGLLTPSRSQGHRRLYSARDIERLLRIKTLVVDLGVNLAGVEVILRLTERMAEMEAEMDRLQAEIQRLAEET
ncbi:MAG: MerR family transcriptional regulator [Chloroflexi bacterium]|nr:MerR family transcriptional regulator [Chloroflexota bacterium]